MTSKKLLQKSVINSSKKILLSIGAHPDDIDIGCAGTVANTIQGGGEAYYLVLTDGSKGSDDPKISNKELIRVRQQEQLNSAKILGVKKVFFLDFVDGELENTLKLREKLVRIIRQIKPTTVICWDPTLIYDEKRQFINHPDHRVCGQATLDAVFPFARNARTFPKLLEEGLQPHVVEEVLLVNFTKSNFYVDISQTLDLKMQAIGSHTSQFRNMKKFLERVKGFNADYGKMAKPKAKYAEAFFRIQLRQPS